MLKIFFVIYFFVGLFFPCENKTLNVASYSTYTQLNIRVRYTPSADINVRNISPL